MSDRRMITRVASNYLRMAGTFAIGLFLVRTLLEFGNDAYAVIVLLTAGLGIGSILKGMVRRSIVPLLGTVYHKGDTSFLNTYNSAIVLCLLGSVASAFMFAGIAFALCWFQVPDDLLFAARCFIVLKGGQTCISIILAPSFNMYIVSERMAAYNFWTLVESACDLLAAGILLLAFKTNNAADVIIGYGAISSALCVGSLVASVVILLMCDRRLLPMPHLASRRAIKGLFRSSFGNSSIVLADLLYFRTDALIVNASLGLFGNLVFGIASQFVSYARMVGMGLVGGLDAVSARVAKSGNPRDMQKLVRSATRMQAFVAFPVALLMFTLAPVAVELWVGDRLSDRATTLPPIVLTVRLLCIGIVARSMGEPWIFILSGTNRIGLVSRIVLIAALANPVAVIVLLHVLPESHAYTAPGWAFSSLSVFVHLVALPPIFANAVGLRMRDVFLPALAPLATTVLCAPIIFCFGLSGNGSPAQSVTCVLAFGAAYACCCLFLMTRRAAKKSRRQKTLPQSLRLDEVEEFKSVKKPAGSALTRPLGQLHKQLSQFMEAD